jgi:hypothetical protein
LDSRCRLTRIRQKNPALCLRALLVHRALLSPNRYPHWVKSTQCGRSQRGCLCRIALGEVEVAAAAAAGLRRETMHRIGKSGNVVRKSCTFASGRACEPQVYPRTR